ncbi:putative ankyrin repeat protein RF_0381 [Leptopilina boulardi]|uniref:putative ankyrin repeat protein RF_0381 n=1 Tax=Leptopilina boulardi TaxID=63433 RepID=UPI0021F550D0|nr:putative ankyrin repeat protein RF_0381 [Leptopilina boulardi]
MSLDICSSLINCCRLGDEEDVKHIITHYKFSDYPELLEGYVLICEALNNDNMQVVKLLLQNGANVNVTRNSTENSPLHLAIIKNNIEILQLLLEKNVRLNVVNKEKKTPLHIAIDQQNEEFVKLLLDKGADTEFKDKFNYTPLHMAIKNGNLKIIQHLINHKADINSFRENETALHFAVKNNRSDIVKLLLKNDVIKINSTSYYSLLFLAVSQCNHKILLLLLEHQNENENEMNVDEKINSESNFKVLLHRAVVDGNREIIAVLVKYNFDINSKDEFGRTPMYHAYTHNKLDICKYLLKSGSSINEKIDENLNILHVSVENNDEKFVKFLLKNGADVNAITINGCTSLHIACRNGFKKIVKLLLKYKSDTSIIDNNGLTCLHEAAKQDDEKILRHLIHEGANVNAIDYNYKTPICYAVENQNTNIVLFLLDKNPNVCNYNNKLAFCLAVLGNSVEHRNIVELFLIRRFKIVSENFDKIHIPEPLYTQFSKEYRKAKYKTMFDELLKHKKPSIKGFFEYRILCCSIEKGFTLIIPYLLKPNANVNVFLEQSFTLLEIAINNCQYKMMRELLKFGADLNTKDIHGNTLLHISVLNDCMDTIEFLLKSQINIEARNKNGETALHLASHRKANIVQLILDAGADINSKTRTMESTALHIAVKNGKENLVKLLLEYDAIVNLKNIVNATPLDFAINCKNYEIIHVLLQYGGTYNTNSCFTSEISEILMQHSIKMKLLAVDEFQSDNSEYVHKCIEEINRMRHCQLEAKISLYDLLIKNVAQVELYMRNEQILLFDFSDFKDLYPIYFDILNVQINKAKRRNMLIKLASNSLENILDIKIPYLVVENIFFYISNLDLRNLIYASNNCN